MAKKRSKSTVSRADWPLHECWIGETWQEPGEITQILVARRAASGQVAYAMFLVDLGCLGIKNADAGLVASTPEYEKVREVMMASQMLVRCSLDLAAKVVHEAIGYARGLGFAPHKDSRKALRLLRGAQPELVAEVVPLGDGSGKPYFVAGPYDNAVWVLRKLDRAVGQGNYDYIVPLDDDSWDF